MGRRGEHGSDGVWRTWGRTAQARPVSVVRPRSEEELAAIVIAARERGEPVKAVGAGHSFSPIAVAPGIQVDMSGMRGLIGLDPVAQRVTVRAGTHLHELTPLLGAHGLAMANLGDVDRQTISGATSTGTHGTGLAFGGLATQIVGTRLVTGTGEVISVTAAEPERLRATALGLGALGILTELTLQCVPAFKLRAVEVPNGFAECVDRFLERVAESDHHEFLWLPHTDRALVKTNTRVPVSTPDDGPPPWRQWVDDELISNKILGTLCAAEARVSRLTPRANALLARMVAPRTYVTSSAGVFISSRAVRFRELEYALPLTAVPEALRAVHRLIDDRGYRISIPIEVRAAAADDLLLSTAHGRATGYIAVHRYVDDSPDGYFDDVEAIMVAHDGRPHWGKMHTRTAEDLRRSYPRFDAFLAVRDALDPDRVFANDHLNRVLGA